MRVLALVVGIAITAWTLTAMVRSMLIPHGRRDLLAQFVRSVVRAVALVPLRFMPTYRAQDLWLASMGPIGVILQLVVYAVLFIVGLGLMVYAVTDLTLGQSLYQSGSTFTTLGIVEPVNTSSTVVTFVAAFLGLIVIAVFIGYLMGTYSAYTTREAQMARIAMIAGEPAWGPQIIVRAKMIGLPAEQAPAAASWIDWITVTRMNTTVNIVLGDFRSTSPWRHWVTTLLAVLDAAALRLALDPMKDQPELVELLTEGATSLRLLAMDNRSREPRIHNWSVEAEVLGVLKAGVEKGAVPPECGVTRAEFDDALRELAAVGVAMPGDLDAAWARFASVRCTYASSGEALAIRHHAVHAPWSGARKPPVPVVWPIRAGCP